MRPRTATPRGCRARRTCARALLAAALGTAALTPSATAAGWTSPQIVSAPGQYANEPRVGIAADGTATVLWRGPGDRIDAATRPLGAVWSPPWTLSAPDGPNDGATLAVAPDGTATAIWSRLHGGDSSNRFALTVAERASGRAWSGPYELAEPAEYAGSPAIATAPDGTVTAVWQVVVDGRLAIRSARRSPDETWGPAATVSTRGIDSVDPRVAVAPDGTATVVWSARERSAIVIRAASQDAAGWWSSSTRISAHDRNALAAELAVDDEGTVTAAWPAAVHGGYRIEAATWSPVPATRGNGSSSAPWRVLSGSGAAQVRVVAGPAGTAVVAWRRFDGEHARIEATGRSASGTWEPPHALSAPDADAAEVALATDALGTTTAVWSTGDGDRLVSARRSGGTWDDAETIFAAGDGIVRSPRVAIAPGATPVVSWHHQGLDSDVVRVMARDASGPTLDHLEVPASAVAGSPVAVSVQASDDWSTVQPVGWEFGDGNTATGRGARHVYAEPGRYVVTATARDEHANESRASREIVVSPVPVRLGGDAPREEAPPAPMPIVDPPAPEQPPLPETPTAAVCALPRVALAGAESAGSSRRPTVRLTGVVVPALAGRRVVVERNGRRVATATADRRGLVTATVRAPAAARARGAARYRLSVAGTRSASLRAGTAVTARRVVRDGDRLRISGRVAGVRAPTRVTVSGTLPCAPATTTVRVTTDRRGRFRAELAVPGDVVLALALRVRVGTHSYALPVAVAAR